MTETIATVIIVLLVVNLLGLAVVGFRVGRQSSDARDFERRLNQLEARVANLPTHQDLQKLTQGMAATAEAVATLNGQMRTMTDMMRAIQEHLLDNERHRR